MALGIECLDRLYLNGYVPILQCSGQVVNFMREHLDLPVPSPAIFERIGERFRTAARTYADQHKIPLVPFKKGARHIDVMRPYLDRATAPSVVAIGVSQEFQWVFTGTKRPATIPGAVRYGFDKAERRVSCYYFYIVDADFGPGFLKICSYFPYPMKVWLNGHEWAKRQATKTGLAFSALAGGFNRGSNGFASCAEPTAPYKYPRWIVFVDELPKTATGKIQRFNLRERDGK